MGARSLRGAQCKCSASAVLSTHWMRFHRAYQEDSEKRAEIHKFDGKH